MSFKLAHSYDFSVLLYSVHFTHFAAHTTANICMLLELILVVSMLTVHRIHSFTFGLKWHAIATSRRSIGMQSNIGKKKVALVISYVGSNYHGLQINPNATVPFIETKLQQALVDIEAILPSNAGDLGKIDWSRSSRTDKGVHAARLIISAKLEIHPKWLDDSEKNNGVAGTGENLAPARYKKLVCDLNSRLPSDIRAMSCIRINNSFQARDACTWREYEYLLPVDVLTSPSATTSDDTVHSDAQSNLYSIRKPAHLTSEEAVERFNAALQVFVGPQSFHNFNNIKTKEMNRFVSGVKHWEEKGQKGHHNNRNRELLSETVDDSEALLSESLGDSAEDVNATCISSDTETALKEGNNATESGSGRAFDLSYHIHEDWQPVERPMVNQVKHIIYRAQATLLTDASGKQMIAVSLRGSGFVLNQIRLMMGALILVVRGVLPLHSVQAALLCPYRIRFPTAPAEGLYLQNAGFGSNANKTIGMSITNPDYPDDVHLLDPEEFEASEEFKNTHIRPRIVQDWYANDSFLINEFVQFCEKFRPSAEVVDQWQSLLQAQLDANEKESLKSAVSYKNRVGRIIRDFHEAVEYAAWRKEQKQAKRAASVSAYESKKKGIVSPHQQGAAHADVVTDAKSAPTDKRRTPREIKHRSLLPDSFHSELLIRFNAFPGERVDLALRALAYKIAVGEIAPGLSASELLDIIEGMAVKQGGMEQCGDLSRTVGCFSSFSGGDALKSGMSGIDYLARLAPKHELIL